MRKKLLMGAMAVLIFIQSNCFVVQANEEQKAVTATQSVIQQINDASITGNQVVVKGKSFTFTLVKEPKKTKINKVKWSVLPENAGVTIKNGKVTVAKDCELTSFEINAESVDGTVNTSRQIGINDLLAGKVFLSDAETGVTGKTSFTRTLFSTEGNTTVDTDMQLQVSFKNYETFKNVPYEFVSTVPEIATVDQNGYVKATGIKAGKTTIKCILRDGTIDGNSNPVCASATVNVINPASSLSISIPNGRSEHVAVGKTLALKALVGEDFGKVASKAVLWQSSDTSVATVNKDGVVKMLKASEEPVTITATMKDGCGQAATVDLYGTQPIKNMSLADADRNDRPGYAYTLANNKEYNFIVMFNAPYKDDYIGTGVSPDLAVKSTNPSLIEVESGKGTLTVKTHGESGKKATVTVTAMDGTGKKQNWTFTIE